MKKEDTVALRRKYIAPCVELFFKDDPLKIVKGSGQYMYDERGNKYLDCINNVAHVGHCHPHVVKKVSEQMGHLETNSRFLHDNLVIYCDRLSKYLPSHLSRFFFTNSGSEANDLAMRIARKMTGAYDVIVLDHAYHGHLTNLVDISPYKFARQGGEGKREWVHVCPVPDVYRGKYRNADNSNNLDEDKMGDLYFQEIVQIVENAEKNGRRIALFYAESFQSCGGQIIYPKSFMRQTYKYLHSKGILCVADEVQCGFYRSGTHMWGFQYYGDEIKPDFLTIGKSMGNGHPVACLITRDDLAQKFGENGLQYFNTYGGNPVSVSAANAVLDVIETEKLYTHVTDVSTRLLKRFNELKNKHSIIGDVRGFGYFLGLDLVKNRTTREPAIKEAKIVLQKMREANILLSLDGPYSNVMKLKPPLQFNQENADLVVKTLDRVLTELESKAQL